MWCWCGTDYASPAALLRRRCSSNPSSIHHHLSTSTHRIYCNCTQLITTTPNSNNWYLLRELHTDFSVYCRIRRTRLVLNLNKILVTVCPLSTADGLEASPLLRRQDYEVLQPTGCQRPCGSRVYSLTPNTRQALRSACHRGATIAGARDLDRDRLPLTNDTAACECTLGIFGSPFFLLITHKNNSKPDWTKRRELSSPSLLDSLLWPN